jgi:photosystem II stability/assembly factor-like uncharacterized protein
MQQCAFLFQRMELMMRNSSKAIILSLLIFILVACKGSPTSPEASESPLTPVTTQLPTKTAYVVDASGIEPCYMTSDVEITSYLRPNVASEVFDVVPRGMRFIVEARTSDGWVGFNPGIPQAANVGVFRLRWVQESDDLQLEGACDDLPIVEGPPIGVCFQMAMTEIPIYAEPDPNSEIIVTLENEDYVEVAGQKDENWFMVDLSVGSVGITQTGWMEGLWANLNGPCNDLEIELIKGPPIARLNPGDPVTITFLHMVTESLGWAIGRGSTLEDHILRTEDGGHTWMDVTPPEHELTIDEQAKNAQAFFLDPDQAWVMYRAQAPYPQAPEVPIVWRTFDGGDSWEPSQPLDLLDLLPSEDFSPMLYFTDPQHGWIKITLGQAAGSSFIAIFRTIDGGLSWNRMLDAVSEESLNKCIKTGMVFANEEVGLITRDCRGFYDMPFLSWTSDGGLNWHTQNLPPPADDPHFFSTHFCAVRSPNMHSPLSAALVVECQRSEGEDYNSYLSTTVDGGQTWRIDPLPEVDLHGDEVSLQFLTSDIGWWLGKKLYKTNDSGQTWIYVKTVNWEGQFTFVDEDRGWAVARSDDEIALVSTIDGGKTWDVIEPQIGALEGAPVETACMLTALTEVTAYNRPSLEAEIFGTLPLDMSFYVGARTADGWIGFDPASAQAANIGVFRNRWVQEDGKIILEGNCDAIPIVVGPPPGVCFTMPMEDVPIYAGPDTSSKVLVTLHPEDYVEVMGKTEDNWFLVDLSVGNLGIEGTGWMEGIYVNFNGPCMDLPIVTR